MSESCGSCGAQTDREPLCEQCNDEESKSFDEMESLAECHAAESERAHAEVERLLVVETDLTKEVERLRAENAELKELEARKLVFAQNLATRLEAENTELRSKLKRQAALTEEGWDDVPVVDIYELRAENAELRKSVATMSCNHKDIGLPDCRICDPRAKPGAGT